MRNDIEGDLLREILRLWRIIHKNTARLGPEFINRLLPRARGRLIGCRHHAPHAGGFMQRLQDQRQDQAGRQWASNDPPFAGAHQSLIIHPGHHQGHIRFHMKMPGKVNRHGAGRHSAGHFHRGQLGITGEDGEVRAHEVKPRHIACFQHCFFAPGNIGARTAPLGKRHQLCPRQAGFSQAAQDFAPNQGRRANDGNTMSHKMIPKSFAMFSPKHAKPHGP